MAQFKHDRDIPSLIPQSAQIRAISSWTGYWDILLSGGRLYQCAGNEVRPGRNAALKTGDRRESGLLYRAGHHRSVVL